MSPPALDLDGWISAQRAEIERLFAERLVAPPGGDPGRLVEAMRYSLLAPGKRIRPLLGLAAAEAIGGPPVADEVRVACAAVEMVHCYSLVHDDLPAMDDDDFRRGRPSNHKVFGDAIAILVGDALLTLAFEWIAEAGARAKRPEGFLRASLALARGAGVAGMVRGQARDLREPPPDTVGALETLHAEKTAALFGAALEVGAAAAGGRPEEIEALGRYGRTYGVAFQHADDFADADHPTHAAAARARVQSLVAEAVGAVAPWGDRAAPLVALARRLGDAAQNAGPNTGQNAVQTAGAPPPVK